MTGNISLFSYGVAAASYALLTILLATQWRVRPLGPSLLFAASATAFWAGTIAAGTLLAYPPITLINLAELARNAGWLFFLLQLLGFQSGGSIWSWLGRSWVPVFAFSVLIGLAIIGLRPLHAMVGINANDAGDAALMLWLAIAIVGLLLVEQVYRNASSGERWGVKFLCLGLGAALTYDFFMYAEALLFRQLDTRLWQARGLVNAFAVPLLLVAIARNRNWRMDVHVSRHVVFHTVTLMGAGLYLLCMAIIGYFIEYLGGSWGGVLQVSFLAASGSLLFTLLFSGAIRARLRVWVSKHFFSYRYDYRVEWLRFTQELAELENVPPGIVESMASVTLSPGGFLLYRGSSDQLSELASWEFAPPPSPDIGNLPQWLRSSGWVIDIPEWRKSPDIYGDLDLPLWLRDSRELWLIVPLLFREELEGLLFLARTDLKDGVNWEDRDLLKTAGRQAAALLAQQRANQGLIEARQFDAFNRLSAYVVHDLKNILAQQSLILSNARKHRNNPAFVDDMISTVDNSVQRMNRLMEQMRSGIRSATTASVELGALLEQIVLARASTHPTPRLNIETDTLIIADRERLLTVFSHLVQNAQEATQDDGKVDVELTVINSFARVSIVDTGCGMSERFVREKLFTPFESTKGLTGMGIGAFESREYVRQLGGDITVKSETGAGSVFTVTLPSQSEVSTSNNDLESCEPGTSTAVPSMAE
ncbi:PEP-CTERM system histidine kinase PrsK [Congregibacter variabilis]|uniref:histidine kinase n=1 Tax=Congregibacter variabilis TaxID=3081200 RepID=A0ABZ0I8B9_9GAMM|nr:PEP-CTERM system histidine kinase PrsK [Congregibacter sp. IMCC43200]